MTALNGCNGLPAFFMDREVLSVDYSPRIPITRRIPPDGRITAQEFTETSVDFFETAGVGLPWLIRRTDHLRSTLQFIAGVKGTLRGAGLAEESVRFREGLARELAGYVIRRQNGLGLIPASPSCTRELTADEAIETHCADCTEFSMVYYEVCRLAGLSVTFLELTHDFEGNPFPRPHLGVGLRLDPENREAITPVDLTLGGFDVGHQGWHEISKATFLGYQAVSRSLLNRETDRFAELQRALWLAPDNPNIRFAVGNYYLDNNRPDHAVGEFEEALRINPHHNKARQNLAIAKGRLSSLR